MTVTETTALLEPLDPVQAARLTAATAGLDEILADLLAETDDRPK